MASRFVASLAALVTWIACDPATPPARTPAPATTTAAPTAPPPAPALTAIERSALKAQGTAAYERKDWPTCAHLFEQSLDHYDAACCHAQDGKPDAAFAQLALAIDTDFRNQAHLEKDPDLAPLHADPRWQREVAHLAAKNEARKKSLNAELMQIHDQDQADRAGGFEQIDWKQVTPRDQARRKRVDEIIAAGGAKVADDYYHAAMVYQHGDSPDEIQRAHDLAIKAVELDPKHSAARWLAAAAEDRRLMYEKKPQRWGTQFQRQNGVWVLWPVDPATTDEQRAEWNVPPLAAAKARAEAMNARRPQ
jgi:hypothetical protein